MTLWAIFRAPVVIAVASIVGLVAALVGNGLADAASWVGLLVPVAAVVWAWMARRQ
ncbi:hypothetical protein KAJ83_05370 [Marivibrio halodurans]|uniref:Uncharacterized protein n=1 Tax=Marivibrio halodurans TaxID=2039722 RepID=A0A8J7RX95_9PROT|nr:hypothetical protein [Marivibrio halodurans]MBP5856427.1 hypothetical protein [Marivibrio halodurans]